MQPSVREYVNDIEEAGDLLINHVINSLADNHLDIDLTREFNAFYEKSLTI